MSAAPRSPPPPLNGSRSFLKALHALSPSGFGRTKQHLDESKSNEEDATRPMMPTHVMNKLAHLICFLEEARKREEGLYEKLGVTAEALEIRRVCLNADPLPDLTRVNPHSITQAIKEVLQKDFSPLWSASQSLIRQSMNRNCPATVDEIINSFKHLDTATQQLIGTLLTHLHNISTSIACRMSVKSLAKHVAFLLIYPVKDPITVSARHFMKQTKRLAQLMITNAYVLLHNSTEGEKVSNRGSTSQDAKHSLSKVPSAPLLSVHYVQATWDPFTSSYTQESLRLLLGEFGTIVTIATNDSGDRYGRAKHRLFQPHSLPTGTSQLSDRAIISFGDAESARRAADAVLPGLQMRYRAQKYAEKTSIEDMDCDSAASYLRPIPTHTVLLDSTDEGDMQPSHLQSTFTDNNFSPTDGPAEASQSFLYKLERPPSICLAGKALETLGQDIMVLDDFDSPRTSPQSTSDDDSRIPKPQSTPASDASTKPQNPGDSFLQFPCDGRTERRRRSLRDLFVIAKQEKHHPVASDNAKTATKAARSEPMSSPTNYSKTGLVDELKWMLSGKRTSSSNKETRDRAAKNLDDEPLLEKTKLGFVKSTQTPITILPMRDQATDMTDFLCSNPEDDLAGQSAGVRHELEEKLVLCLEEVKLELKKLIGAFSALHSRELGQAATRTHEELIFHIEKALSRTDKSNASHCGHGGCSATNEFVQFLETRSASQVRILEAEVRAGQELLRLRSSQYQKEILELEAETTNLRIVQSETQKMCAGLRDELRKCRAELSCHVASAASIQRDRRDADEKLIVCENKLHAKELELLDLHAKHSQLRETAAQAQKRLEDYRVESKTSTGGEAKPVSEPMRIPRTTAFLDMHQKRIATQETSSRGRLNVPIPSSGVHAKSTDLEILRDKLEERVHAQIQSTKASLRQLQAIGNQCVDDEKRDLDVLEQQLALADAEVESTMNESRWKLDRLCGLEPADRDRDEGTTFDSSELVLNILAKAFAAESELAITRESVTERVGSSEVFTQAWQIHPPTTQSELLKRWMQDRRGESKPPTRTRERAPIDIGNTPLHQAQESMRKFQEALTSVKETAIVRNS